MTSPLEQYLDHVHQQTAFRSGRMEVGKVRSTLTRQQRFSGGPVMTRASYAEARVVAGNVHLDHKRKRYVDTSTGYFFNFADVTLAVVDYTEWLLARKEAV